MSWLDGLSSSSSAAVRIDISAANPVRMAVHSDNGMLLSLFLGREKMPVDTRLIRRFSKLPMILWPRAAAFLTLASGEARQLLLNL